MRKLVRAFLWLAIIPLAVGGGLWIGKAWSQEQKPLTIESLQGELAAVRLQRDFAQQQAGSAAGQLFEMGKQIQELKAEMAKLKPVEKKL